MALERRSEIIETLRMRIERALATGAVCAGDRLASRREMALELRADPRVVGAAYRVLEAEGLVEIRKRSGVYVKMNAALARRSLVPPSEMLVDALTSAVVRGFAGPAFASRLTAAVSHRKLRPIVLASTPDQVLGIARELREDFGVDAVPMVVSRLESDAGQRALRKADFIVATQLHRQIAHTLSTTLRIPHIVMSVRSDLFETEWSLWQGRTVYVVVLDPRFRSLVRKFLNAAGAGTAVRVYLATENLARIPADAPTYITQAARTHLGRARAPGMIITPTRLFDPDCVRALWQIITALNLTELAD